MSDLEAGAATAAPDPRFMFSVQASSFQLPAIVMAALLLAGCQTGGQSSAARTYPSDIAEAGEITAVTTRRSTGAQKSPWFGSERADPSMVRVRLASPYQAGRFSMASSSGTWKIAQVEPITAPELSGEAGGTRDVLLYVHGFNNTFDRAATDAARLSDALRFRGDTVLFSWPSRDSVFDYVADRESALWSRDALEDVLDSLLSNPTVGRVHVVAHSMGGMLTVESLRQLQSSNKGNMSRFGAIVFASPDIDADGFASSIRRLGGLHQKMTVISAQDDRALAIAASLAGGKRVGRADPAALEKLGIKVVDASGMGGFLRHDTFLADAGVQKIVIQAIADASSGGGMNSTPSPVPVFQRDLPVSQQPLAAPPTAVAPATASTPAPSVQPAPVQAVPVEMAPVQAPVATTPAPTPSSLY
jgi:esterase/lipase superfamily enzyme